MSFGFRGKFRKVIRFVDRLSVGWLILIACGSLLFFATVYSILERFNEGPVAVPTGTPISFPNAVYFSVVTFTSLGYGDIVPVGVSKAVACGEVAIGLAFFGIFIAKLSSTKQNYHLAQLYARDAQERLNEYAAILETHRKSCQDVLAVVKKGDQPPHSVYRIPIEVYRTVQRMQAYISFEVSNGDFFFETPIGASARLLTRSARLARDLSALACFPTSLHSQKQRRMARRVIANLGEIGNAVAKNAHDASLLSEAKNLVKQCATATASLDAVTEAVASKFERVSAPKP